jgi:hypothetical protein|tara:strand:- start:725 stop:1342 length:618 start_codon:yes stop_codon:yes gene_type:complete
MGLISNGTTLLDAGAIDSGVATGSMTLIKTLTASSSGTLSFVDGSSSVVLDNTYKEYIFKFYNIHPASDDQNLFFNMSADTGSNYNVTKTTTYFRANHNENDGAASINYRTGEDLAQATGYQKLTLGTNNDNDSGSSGYLHLFEPSSTTFVKHFIARVSDAYGEPSNNDTFIAGYGNTTSAVDAIDFKFGSGNIDSGVIKLYGIK